MDMKKLCSIFFVLIAFCCGLRAQETYPYVERDSTLHLDIYRPDNPNGYTIVHIFGGGFVVGSRAGQMDTAYCRQLTDKGYTAVPIDYRLGLRGVSKVGVSNYKALENAFYLAVEDCSAAVAYLVSHAAELNIDPQKIILEGYSAGAITALMTDYGRCNNLPCTKALPEGWRPAGVIAYSGAIYSKDGKLKWGTGNDKPAPTLLFHGTVDKIVPYKGIALGKLGLFGSDEIAKRLEKFNFPCCIYRCADLGHEVAGSGPMTVDYLDFFVKLYVLEAQPLHTDITIRHDNIRPSAYTKKTVRQLYNGH